MNLTRYEQEVVINLNADEDMATVYSANPAWIRKMDALVKEFPDIFMLSGRQKSVKLMKCLRSLCVSESQGNYPKHRGKT